MAAYRAAVIGCGRIGSTIDDEDDVRPPFFLSDGACARLRRSKGSRIGRGCRPVAGPVGGLLNAVGASMPSIPTTGKCLPTRSPTL